MIYNEVIKLLFLLLDIKLNGIIEVTLKLVQISLQVKKDYPFFTFTCFQEKIIYHSVSWPNISLQIYVTEAVSELH